MNRRSFLKMLAAATAPMFIPASNLWLPPEKKVILAVPEDLPWNGNTAYWLWTGGDDVCIQSFKRTVSPGFEGIFKKFYTENLELPVNSLVDGSFNR